MKRDLANYPMPIRGLGLGGMCGEGKPKSNSGSSRVSELGLCSDKELTLETSATQTLHGD